MTCAFRQEEARRKVDPLASLSSREREVFFLLVNGRVAEGYRRDSRISPKTVDTYRASLMRKLNIHDLAGLVRFAIEKKLIDPSDEQ